MSNHASKIPNGWEMTTLGDLVIIKHGYAFSGEGITDVPTENILLTPGNFLIGGGWKDGKKYFKGSIPSDYILKQDDLIVTMTDLSKDADTLGYPALIPNDPTKEFLHNQRIGVVTVNEKLASKKYVYFLLRFSEYQRYVVNSATGSTVRHTSPTRIQSFEFLKPQVPEQCAIATVLSSLDDKIKLLREQNKSLEATAQAIFKEWFVNFNFPGSTGKMIDSEMGEIPERWRVGRLSDIANFLNGLALQKYPPESNSEYLPVVKIKELNSGISEQSDRASSKLDKKYVVDDGDVLFSWSGSLLVDIWKYGKGALNQHLFKVTSDSYPKWFYFYWIKVHLPSFQQTAIAKAVTMGHIQRHHLDDALVAIPSDQFMQIANNLFDPMILKLINNNAQIKTLITTRDTLLPKLMKGEVRVKGFNN